MQTYQSAIDQLERELQVERNQRVALQGELQRIQQDLKSAQHSLFALHPGKQRLVMALEVSGLGMWDWHLATNKIYYDSQWKMMLGYDVEEIANQGYSFEQLVHPEDLPRVMAIFYAYLEHRRECYQAEFRMLAKSGEWKWILAQGKIIEWDELGKPVRIVGTHTEITDHKEHLQNCEELASEQAQTKNTESQLLQTALQESQHREQETNRQLEIVLQELQTTQGRLVQTGKMANLGQLMAGITNEINNPVNFLYSNINPANEYAQGLIRLIELYQRHYPKPPAALQSEIDALELEFLKTDFAKLLWSMRASADRIKEIVQALGDFSRFDQNKLKKADLHDGIDSTLMILQHRLREQPQRAAIEVIKDYGELPLVECYLGELNQAFMSILNNAIDALEERMKHDFAFIPQIWITTEVVKSHLSLVPNTDTIQVPQFKDRKVLIRITDNGKGMLPHIQKRIFEPCFTTKSMGSNGLGLSICQQIIVEKHQGKLKCISQFSKGTEFVIELYPKIKSLNSKKAKELGVK